MQKNAILGKTRDEIELRIITHFTHNYLSSLHNDGI